jgi:hypothetical protein
VITRTYGKFPDGDFWTGIASECPFIQAFPLEAAPKPHPRFADTSKLFSRVKHSFKLADFSHYGIKIGFLTKIHFSHFLVVPAEGLFELVAGRKAETSLPRALPFII